MNDASFNNLAFCIVFPYVETKHFYTVCTQLRKEKRRSSKIVIRLVKPDFYLNNI